jgi:hypothetical protein
MHVDAHARMVEIPEEWNPIPASLVLIDCRGCYSMQGPASLTEETRHTA